MGLVPLPPFSKAGGLAIYVANLLIIQLPNFKIKDEDCEDVWVKITLKIAVN